MVPWPDNCRAMLGTPKFPSAWRQERAARGFWQRCLSTRAPFPPLHGEAGAKVKVLGAAWTPTAAPWHLHWWLRWRFPKPLKGKENCAHSSSASFLPALVSFSQRTVSSRAVSVLPRGSRVGVGLWLHLGIVTSKRNNNNKKFDGKQGDREVQLLPRPDLQLAALPEPLWGVLGSLCCGRFCCVPEISWRSGEK